MTISGVGGGSSVCDGVHMRHGAVGGQLVVWVGVVVVKL